MLMHFLDATKFGSLEEFQTEYEDLGEAKQARLDWWPCGRYGNFVHVSTAHEGAAKSKVSLRARRWSGCTSC